MDSARACCRLLLEGHCGPIRQGLLKGHGLQLPPRCSRPPRDEAGLLTGVFHEAFEYPVHIYAIYGVRRRVMLEGQPHACRPIFLVSQ